MSLFFPCALSISNSLCFLIVIHYLTFHTERYSWIDVYSQPLIILFSKSDWKHTNLIFIVNFSKLGILKSVLISLLKQMRVFFFFSSLLGSFLCFFWVSFYLLLWICWLNYLNGIMAKLHTLSTFFWKKKEKKRKIALENKIKKK